eukprot:2075789-Pyramimonas_sp.AAC.1
MMLDKAQQAKVPRLGVPGVLDLFHEIPSFQAQAGDVGEVELELIRLRLAPLGPRLSLPRLLVRRGAGGGQVRRGPHWGEDPLLVPWRPRLTRFNASRGARWDQRGRLGKAAAAQLVERFQHLKQVEHDLRLATHASVA